MLAALAFATLLAGPTTIELTPSDDVWVYPHSSDARDAYLRVWGAEGRDVARDLNEMQDFGYSYVRFDLSKVPAGKVSAATLVVTHIANPGYDAAYAKQNPLRARPLAATFSEKTWDYSKAEDLKPEPGDKEVFGGGYPETIPADKEFKITIDLMKGPKDFKAYFDTARSSTSKAMGLALTATMDVEEHGQGCIYKFYSKDCETATKRPVLKLTIDG